MIENDDANSVTNEIEDAETDFENTEMVFILNTNTKRIHMVDCKSVKTIKEHNKVEYTGTIKELKEKGYKPCGNCLAHIINK